MTFLIDFGIKSAMALGLAFLVVAALRRRSASVRYAVWTCGLAAVLVLPLVLSIGPNLPVRSAWHRATDAPQTVPQTASISVVVHARRPASSSGVPMTIWIAGMVAMLARIAAGHWRVRSLFGSAETICDPLVEEIAANIGFRRAVLLKRSMATDVPVSYGLVRATVLLPGESAHWTEERRRIVLSHEMIHARRLDSLWGLLAQCALAANWFNPLAWLACKQFRREQERSCDDAVVTAGTASTLYAAHLVDLARSIAIPEPALGMAEAFDLEGRVHALLDPARRRKAVSGKVCAAISAAALALVVPLAAVRAQSDSPARPAAQIAAAPAPKIEEAIDEASNDVVREQVAINRPTPQAAAHAPSASSSTSQATFAVTVRDPSGAAIPGAMLSLRKAGADEKDALEGVALTDAVGRHEFKIVADAQYWITVKARGFETEEMGVSANAGRTAAVDFSLRMGEIRETVEIAATRPQSASGNTTPQRIRVGGLVQAANLISRVNPAYPADAQSEGIEGTVLLRAVVSKDGSLLSVKSISNGVDPRLVNAALAAVPLWRYQPALLNAEPVEVLTTIAVTFRLN